MRIKKTAIAIAMAVGLGVGGVTVAAPASAAPSCTGVTGQPIPSNVAQYICSDGRAIVPQPGSSKPPSTKQMIMCAGGMIGSPLAGASWCLFDIGFPDFSLW